MKFNIHTKTYSPLIFDKTKSKPLADIICLYVDKESILYIGTSSGLTQVKNLGSVNNEIKQFSRADGIMNDMIHGILEDGEGIIWLSTNKGLVKYNPSNDAFFNVRTMQLDVNEFSDDAYWKCPMTDRLFFGGVNGLVWIEPNKTFDNEIIKPELLFTELNCKGEQQILYDYNEQKESIKLGFDQNTFNITFAILDYVNGENYDYFYKLEGYDNSWNSLKKENKIHFTNLPHGKYQLKVKYRNDMLADDTIHFINIEILPPWYQSNWAYTIYVILFFICIILAAYFIRRNFKYKQQKLANRIKEEEKEKMYDAKMSFFSNVTHELCTPLTLINGALEQIQKNVLHKTNEKYLDLLKSNVINLN